jgi:hypothetical protein
MEGVSELSMRARDLLLQALRRTRNEVPGIDLVFRSPTLRYDADRDVVTFVGDARGESVQCAVSREALEDHFGANDLDRKGRLEAFRKSRSEIEALMTLKYLSMPVEEVGSVLLKTMDVDKLARGSVGIDLPRVHLSRS